MKTRKGYVSNSSSSSFVIVNWSSLDDYRKDMVKNYTKHVRRLWERLGLPVCQTESDDAHLDADLMRDSDEWVDGIQKSVLKENLDGLDMDELAEKLDFGWLDDGWTYTERDDGTLELSTIVDNFDMGKWLNYIGGIDYRDNDDWDMFSGDDGR